MRKHGTIIVAAAVAGLLSCPPLLSAFTPGWMKAYGSPSYDTATALTTTDDGGFLVVGYSEAAGPDVAEYSVTKLSPYGVTTWQKFFGGQDQDYASAVCQTADGGFLIAGDEGSFDRKTGRNVWVIKLGAAGDVLWERTYGGKDRDEAGDIQPAADGGSIVVGSTLSFGAGGEDAFVLRLGPTGTVIWQKAYGGPSADRARAVRATGDGGFVVAGTTESAGAGRTDVWVLRLESDGGIRWEATYGGPEDEIANAVVRAKDGGLIVAGTTESYGDGFRDAWILRLDAAGSILWQKAYGGTGMDSADSVLETPDGSIVVAGQFSSVGTTSADAWVFKLGPTGNIKWQKAYGGTRGDTAYSLEMLPQGGYVVAGYTSSFGAGGTDALVLRLGASGEIGTQCGNALRATHEKPVGTAAARSTGAAAGALTKVKLRSPAFNTLSPNPGASHVCGPLLPELAGSFGPFDYDPQTGETKVIFTCRNAGTGSAGAFRISLYFSKTSSLGSDSVLVGTDPVDGLGLSSTYTMRRQRAKSDYVYAITVVDDGNAVGEFDETNNASVALIP